MTTKGTIEIDVEGTEVEFHYTYESGDPGIHTYPNGDPGVPPTGPDVTVTAAFAVVEDKNGAQVYVDILDVLEPHIDLDTIEEQIIEDIMDMDSGISGATVIDRDAEMPRYLASMFYKSSRDSTTSIHLPNGRGLDNVEIGRIVGSRSSDFENQADFLEDIRKKSKAK